MWQISLQKKDTKGHTIILTKSKYPSKQQAQAAATQLRMISKGWIYGIRSIECDRPNAKPPKWKFHNYFVTPPEEIKS